MLLADEPTGNLDSKTGREIFKGWDRSGNRMVLITHKADFVQHAHRVIHLMDGAVEREDIDRELFGVNYFCRSCCLI